MRLLAGLITPTSGSIRVEGLNPAQEGTRLREFTGYMPQKFGLYEDLSVRENLHLHAALRGVSGAAREESFKRLLTLTNLAEFTERLAGKLSGGMKQKLGLACSLLGTPRFLLLDEPGVGVDPISRRDLWSMVSKLVDEGLTVVWSTAYLDEAELCAQVLLMNEGKLLFAGQPGELTAGLRDRCALVRNIQGSRRQVLTTALRLPQVLDGVVQGSNVRLVFKAGHPRPSTEALAAGAAAEIVPTAPRFEDAFIDLLGGGPGGDSALVRQAPRIEGRSSAVVEAVDLTRRFGSFTAADRITFSVRRGEVFGLLGPNGAGKSTTFRMLCGLLAPTSGTARVMDHDLRRSSHLARQRLGYMAQKFSLYGNLSVRQNLDFFSGAYGLCNARQRDAVGGMIETFHLQPYVATAADTLPLGLKQRLALACALMHQPDVLFLDEPTSGVDPVTRREFWSHINGLVEKGVTIVVTTHFMEEAEYCDRVALVSRGKLIASGTPDDLKAQAASPALPEPSMEDAFIALVQEAGEIR